MGSRCIRMRARGYPCKRGHSQGPPIRINQLISRNYYLIGPLVWYVSGARYEYTIVTGNEFPNINRINELAEEGWRVVAGAGGGDERWVGTFIIMERRVN